MLVKSFKSQNEYLTKFNNQYKIGDTVKYRNSPYSDYTIVTVRTEAFMSHGNAVVFFFEISGYCSVDPQFIYYD